MILSILEITVLINSCKKDNAEKNNNTTYPNFSRFDAGSYWIYQRFNIDSSGYATPTEVYDSCYVEKDTIINSKTYVKTYRPDTYGMNSNYSIVRDSLHYIVSVSGKIYFSSQDFQTVFESKYFKTIDDDTICLITSKMADKDLSVDTPAGTFTTSDFLKTYHMYPNWSFAGNPRFTHTRFAENVGIVVETLPFFTSSPNYIERRLLHYHVNIIGIQR